MLTRRFTNILCLLVSSFISLLLLSCDKEIDDGDELSGRTVFVYLGRDNDLSGGSEEKIGAMLQGWDGKGRLLFYQDLAKKAPCLLEAYREGGENKTKVIFCYEEENSADAKVFGRVLTEVINRYPADSYGLVLFSHASGWLPAGTMETQRRRSVVKDQADEMELTDFAAAIPDGTFDFIVFESCLMAGIEVAYELKDKTDYILASSAEILSPGFKDIYASSINHLFQTDADLVSFARDIYNQIDNQSGVYRSGTLSVIKTSGLIELGKWIKSNFNPIPFVDLSYIQYFDRTNKHLFYDFEDYFSYNLDTHFRRELANRIADCIVYQASTPTFMLQYNGFYINSHSGLTTYVLQDKYPSLNEQYRNLRWYREVLADKYSIYKNP